jgi:hypothetical protein
MNYCFHSICVYMFRLVPSRILDIKTRGTIWYISSGVTLNFKSLNILLNSRSIFVMLGSLAQWRRATISFVMLVRPPVCPQVSA